jgi:hypothetical protein
MDRITKPARRGTPIVKIPGGVVRHDLRDCIPAMKNCFQVVEGAT